MSDVSGGTRQRQIAEHLLGSADVMRRTAESCLEEIDSAAAAIADSFRRGGRLLLCGNGGSAADCQHIAAEFMSVLDRRFLRPGLPALALTTDTSFLTASANDFGYDGIFARQVETFGRPGDVLLAISTSGKSANVVFAAERARALGLLTIALTGAMGGPLAEGADIAIRVPSEDVQHIQETHTAVGHVVCLLTERSIYGDRPT